MSVHKMAAILFAVTYVFFNKCITWRHASYKTRLCVKYGISYLNIAYLLNFLYFWSNHTSRMAAILKLAQKNCAREFSCAALVFAF